LEIWGVPGFLSRFFWTLPDERRRRKGVIGNIIGPEIRELIEARNFSALKEVLVDFSPADVAELITDLADEDQAVVFRLLPREHSTEVVEYLSPDAQQVVLRAMGREDAARILNEMSADDRTALLEELPGTVVAQMLTLLSPEERAVAQSLLNYPEGSVGRLMTPDFVSVRSDWDVRQVLDHIRQHGQDSETLNVIYVTDEQGRLIDDVRIREILLCPVDTRVSEIHDSSFIALRATDEAAVALEKFKKYDRNTLPVIDSQDKLLGIVTVDDMLDVQEEKTTEEIQKMGAVEVLDEPYLDAPVHEMVRKRATWLVVLFIGEMFTASAMGGFQKQIEKASVLALFVPLIMSSGGNSGSQASTLIIRALAVGELRLRDWWRVMRKEVASGLCLGGILGLLGFLRIEVWSYLSPGSYGDFHFFLAAAVGLSIMGVVIWGTLSGSMLPLLLRRIGLDPASSSAPFVATMVDVTGLLLYFFFCSWFLKGSVL
jgi:magnesium transporter